MDNFRKQDDDTCVIMYYTSLNFHVHFRKLVQCQYINALC